MSFIIAEYIWLDANKKLRSKTKIIELTKETLQKRENKIYKDGVEVSEVVLSKTLEIF